MNQRTGATALIEERIDTGLKELLESYQPPFTLGGQNRDELAERFTINTRIPLPQFNTTYAQAFDANDANNPNRQLYALVMRRGYNYRTQAIESLLGAQHPHLLSVLAHGTVFISSMNESFNVVVLDKPAGMRLSELITKQRINQEHLIRDSILSPVCKALLALREKQIVHCGINLDSLYISDVLQVGECVSHVCGSDQHYLYEPLERMMADTMGKGPGNEKVDVYAAAVVSYELLYGLDHLKRMPKEQFIAQALDLGTYHLFANNRDFPDGMQDFFRGILNDNPPERWNLDQLQQWLNGKRFNMINASSTHDSVRPITFDGKDFYSQRALAHDMHQKWRDAIKDARSLKLDRWAEMSLHKPEIGEYINRAIRIAGSESAASERQNNDMLTRIITTLDPISPLRTRLVSVRPDGIGYAIADFIERSVTTELQQLLDIIESDIPNYWAEILEASKSPEYSQLLWRLQRVRTHLKMRSLGFGLERALYDLNPNLPCQSPLVLPYHITTISDLLKTLDVLSKKLAPNTPLLDRHIAAFIASKIDMGKDIKIHELSAIPQLAHNQELVMMKILAKAQTKQDKTLLPGLCTWAAMRIETMLDSIHNRGFRRKLKLQLKPTATAGYINDVINIIVTREIASRDHSGFSHAIALYQVNSERIDKLQNPKVIEKMSAELGGRIAALMSYTILSVTAYIALSDVMGW